MPEIVFDGDLQRLDEAIEALPNAPGVFVLRAGTAGPYLAKTNVLKRRLVRLLGERAASSRMLHLRSTITSARYWLTGSSLESALRMYDLAREIFPKDYAEVLRFRYPAYVKLLLANPFPRTMVTTQIGGRARVFGPFRSRASAERFESECLDLFQLRRCQEDLAPSPGHPGCMYGEMGMCLRPCQEVVTPEEYASEARRVADFLATGGQSLLHITAATRDRFSVEMDFEEAARLHKRYERIEEVLRLADEMVRDLDHLNALTITRACEPGAVEIGILREARWQGFVRLNFELVEGKPVSIDRKLRELLAAAPDREASPKERQEQLALLSRWYYSTWRDGELMLFDRFDAPPFRKLVHAISRVLKD